MSYYSYVELTWDDSDYTLGNLTFSDIEPIVRQWAKDCDIHPDVILDIKTIIENPFQPCFNGLDGALIQDLFACIAETFPQIHFFVRGMGEEFDDMWKYQFINGKLVEE